MTLSNSIFAVSGAATFLDARKDMSNLFACDTSLKPHPGLLTVGGASAANGNVVVGMSNRMAVTVRPFQAVLNRLGALLIMNDGDVTVSLQAAPSANSRIDVVYVKQRERRAPISDSEDGPIIGVVTGTANLTPVAPHVPDGAVALAQVRVPSGVTNTTAGGVVITQVYPFAATRGEELRFRSKGDMDAFAALDGTKAVTLSDDAHYVRENNRWVKVGHLKSYDLFIGSNDGNIQLSDSAANYDYITIYYVMDGTVYGSTEIDFPNNRWVSVSATRVTGEGVFIANINYHIQGNKIVRGSDSRTFGYTNTVYVSNSVSLAVVKVVGWK